jgi:AcrR family transcriptional regulator
MLPSVALRRKPVLRAIRRPGAGIRPPARKPRGRYHHGDLRGSAVAAALAALDTGRPLPSLRELATSCGVAHPSLYRHFRSAEDLRLSAAAACFRDFAAAIRIAAEREHDPFERLRAGCLASLEWGLTHRARYALMMGPELAGKQHHQEFFAAAREAFDLLVDAVAACGVASPVHVAHTIMSALHGLVDLLRKGRTIPHQAAAVDDQISAMIAMVLGYAREAGTSSRLAASRPRS